MRPLPRGNCFASLLTPPGRAAVATIAVQGSEALRIVGRLFTAASRRSLDEFPLRRIVFGRWEPPRARDGNAAERRDEHQLPEQQGEEVVVCRLTEQHLEVHCHGGAAAATAIIRSLTESGCELRSWQQSLDRPLWPGSQKPETSRDPWSADAIIALASARTERAAAILLDQYRGALRDEWNTIDNLIQSGELDRSRQRLEDLLRAAEVGLHLTTPWKVTLAGAPNAGKSSLMNALLGYSRALVSDQPGTTRDALAAPTALHGWPVELTDTAGLREAATSIESLGVEIARQQIAAADLVVHVVDAATFGGDAPWVSLPAGKELVVWSKCDLPNAHTRHSGLRTSALTGAGIPSLIEAIVARLVPNPPPPGAPVPFLPRHIAEIRARLEPTESSSAGTR